MALITADMERKGGNDKMTIFNQQGDRQEELNAMEVDFGPNEMTSRSAVLTTKQFGNWNNGVITMMKMMIGGSVD